MDKILNFEAVLHNIILINAERQIVFTFVQNLGSAFSQKGKEVNKIKIDSSCITGKRGKVLVKKDDGLKVGAVSRRHHSDMGQVAAQQPYHIHLVGPMGK